MELRFSPINRLPYDILREIIIYTAVFPDLYDDSLSHVQVVSPPIVASHICRSWRHALLSDPTMWTCISVPTMKPNFIMELLHRSGSSSLNVFIVLKRPRTNIREYNGVQTMLPHLFEQMGRFKSLYIRMLAPLGKYSKTLGKYYDRILSYLPRPAPRLRMFFLWYRSPSQNPGETSLDSLFSGDAPNLKSISHLLSSDLREINRPLFHDLFELHLYLRYVPSLDYNRFFNFLELSPRLKLLHISMDSNKGFVPVPSAFSSTRQVSFPYLKMLVFEADRDLGLLNTVLETISLPMNAKFQITIQSLFESSSPMRQYLSQARFTSLTFRFFESRVTLSFEGDPASEYLNQFGGSTFTCDLKMTELINDWNLLMEYTQPSNITRLNFDFVWLPPYMSKLFEFKLFPIIIASAAMRNVESITILVPDDSKILPTLLFLSGLLPNPDEIAAVEYHNVV